VRIRQLQQILEIISCGSINKAAQKLYISQSGLCATLNAVEKKLGQQILRRSYNGITLTPFGLEFVKSARQIVEIYDQLLVKSLPNEHSRLCISSEFLLYASSAFTMLCNELGDNTEYRFAEKTNDVVLQDVLGEVSDLGIIVTPTAVRERVFSVFEQIGLEGSVLCINECSCLVGPHSPLYQLERDAVPLEHLALYPRLRYERRPWPVDKDVFRIQDDYFPCSSWITINDAGSFQNFLSRTNCFFVGIHNRTAYKKIGYYNNIRTLGLSDAGFSWDTIWLRRKGCPLSPLTKRYLRLLYDLVEVPYDSQIL